jgi:hypothetical protein
VDCSAVGLDRAADLAMKYGFAFSNFYRMSVQIILVFAYDMVHCRQGSTAFMSIAIWQKDACVR